MNHANTSATSTTADNGALGYARVSSDGGVSETMNITAANVTAAANPGAYCFHDLPFTPHNVQVTPDPGSTTADVYGEIPGDPGDCAGAQAAVFTFAPGTSTRKPAGFYVLFH